MDLLKAIGSENKSKPRFIWTPSLEEALVYIWRFHVEKLVSSGSQKPIYIQIQKQLAEVTGSYVTFSEIRCKFKNLRRKFRDETKKIEEIRGYTTKWKSYDKMADIMTFYPQLDTEIDEASQPYQDEYIVAMSSPDSSEEMSRSEAPAASLDVKRDPEETPNKKRKRSFRAMLLEEFQRSNEASERIAQERNDLQREANALMARSLKVQEAILKKLK